MTASIMASAARIAGARPLPRARRPRAPPPAAVAGPRPGSTPPAAVSTPQSVSRDGGGGRGRSAGRPRRALRGWPPTSHPRPKSLDPALAPDAGRGGAASTSGGGRGAAALNGPSAALSPLPSPSAAGDILIELDAVHKAFGAKPVLSGASLKIRRGEAVGVIGGSGTGKSTTLRLAAGLLEPDAGTVRILGKARAGLLADDPDLAAALRVGLVFQNGALFDSLTVGRNVGFLLEEHSTLAPAEVADLVADALASVGLSGVEALYPSELSGGMRKRVALARAIVRDGNPDAPEQVLLYDEPTAGLDPVASTVVEDLIRSLHRPSPDGRPAACSAYVVVTHQHSTIRRAVDRLVFLHAGAVVWEGTVAEFDSSTVPIVAQFREGALDGPIKYE